MEVRYYECPNCGANIEIKKGVRTQVCEYCDSKFDLELDPWEKEAFSNHTKQTDSASGNGYNKAENTAQGTIRDCKFSDMFQANDPRNIWRKCSCLWVLAVIVLGWITGASSASVPAALLSLVFFIGGIILLIMRAKLPPYNRSVQLPIYVRWGFILVIGFFTIGIYWVAGPFIRWWWKFQRGL